MATILNYWKESLGLLNPKKGKLFALATVNALIYTFKVVMRAAWPVLLFIIGVGLISGYGFAIVPFTLNELFRLTGRQVVLYLATRVVMHSVLVMTVCLAARPSAPQKDTSYILYYLWSRWPILFVTAVVSALPVSGVVMTPMVIFGILFSCDESPGMGAAVQSMVRGVKMYCYNAPMCLVITGVLFLMDWTLMALGVMIGGIAVLGTMQLSFNLHYIGWIVMIGSIVTTLLAVGFCAIVLFTNLYIKWIYDRPELYLPGPKQSDQ